VLLRIVIPIAIAGLAFTAAGCGSAPSTPGVAAVGATTTTAASSSETPSASTGSKADDATRFSACMRSHGVPKFPDPSSGGGINISPAMGVNPNSPVFQAAQRACQKLMPGAKSLSPAQQAKAQEQMLKFSACMRSHGLPSFPDPKFSGGGIQLQIRKGSGLDPSSPVFQAAQKACEKLMPGRPNGKGSVTQRSSGPGGGPRTKVGP
jgi:hypothetical protein